MSKFILILHILLVQLLPLIPFASLQDYYNRETSDLFCQI